MHRSSSWSGICGEAVLEQGLESKRKVLSLDLGVGGRTLIARAYLGCIWPSRSVKLPCPGGCLRSSPARARAFVGDAQMASCKLSQLSSWIRRWTNSGTLVMEEGEITLVLRSANDHFAH